MDVTLKMTHKETELLLQKMNDDLNRLNADNARLKKALEEIACLGRPDTPGELDEPYSARAARKALSETK
jgi:hypothetical protein